MFGRAQGINFGNVPKLLAPEISLGGNFSYDFNGQFYSTTTIYGYIKKKEISTSYETLLALMNSSLCWWFLKNTGTVLANGYFRYKPTYLYPFPIPHISNVEDSILKSLVKCLMGENDIYKRENIEIEIENKIYELYGLTPNDIRVIEK